MGYPVARSDPSQIQNITIWYSDTDQTTEYVVVSNLQIHESGALIYQEVDQDITPVRTRILAPGTWDTVEVVA